jgi:peptide/nickel transport system substrate-binding protein
MRIKMAFYKKIFRLLLIAFFITSCASKSKSDKQVFAYNQVEGIATLDPAFAKSQATMWVAHQLYNTLVETDSNLNIVPSLAKSWEVSDNRLLYTFHLRSDVYFHDNAAFPGGKGKKMTADDIATAYRE